MKLRADEGRSPAAAPYYTAHTWRDVLALFENIGAVHRKANDKFALDLAGERYLMHKPHTKDLTSSEVLDLRHFLQRGGWSPEALSPAADRHELEPATLMVVVDHDGAKIYRIESGAGDAAPRQITPHDPHHFLHHLTHKEQSREAGQRVVHEIDAELSAITTAQLLQLAQRALGPRL